VTEVGFYHLTGHPLDVVLPRLLEKAVGAGHRVVIRSADPALLARLDGLLWTYDPASFLAHAVDGDHAAAQPILLTASQTAANDADILAVVDGEVPEDLTPYARVLYLFDGEDPDALVRARSSWKTLRGGVDIASTYWREDDNGRWAKVGGA